MSEVTGSIEQATPRSGWQRFWDQGGWWRAFLFAVLYIAVYLGLGWLVGVSGLLALAAAVWLNHQLGRPTRSLIAYTA